MRSLFAKILIWFWATLAITIILSALVSALTEENYERPSLFSRIVSFQFEEARNAYLTGGRPGLAAYFERFRAVYRGPAYFTDAAGRDLLTGADRSRLIMDARKRPTFPIFAGGRRLIAHAAGDGAYWFIYITPRRPLIGWFLRPEHWWVMLAAVLLCYWLAYHLTNPVRRLQKAVERFGRGDLSARAGSSRRDELGQLARTFDQMADRIETLLAAQRRLLMDISHELRSPLARLGVAVELARSGENRDSALDRIEKEADRLNTLVGELLQVTRAEGETGSLKAEPVRLDCLLGELVEDSSIEAQARGCAVEFRAAPPVTVQGDPELLRRAVENVIRNAIRYAPRDSAVQVTLERRNGTGVVRVRDCGPGVPDEALDRLFDAFYRVDTDRNRTSGGAGLGLSIARRAIELHKGSIHASNAHPGLLVEMELPVQEQQPRTTSSLS